MWRSFGVSRAGKSISSPVSAKEMEPTVTGKWRIMFQVDETENEIVGLNNEEYQ
jgi:hypothetical protein